MSERNIKVNKKKIKIIIILIIIIIIMLLIIPKITNKKDSKNVVKNYIEKKGFSQVEKSNIYSKIISNTTLDEYFENTENNIATEYQVLYFNLSNYKLSKTYMEYKDNVYRYYTPTYDYKTNTIEYEYEISIEDGYINLTGSYNVKSKKITCNIGNSKNINTNSENLKEAICNKILYNTKDFGIEALELMSNSTVINKLQSK